MTINQIFELSMTIDSDEFEEFFNGICCNSDRMEETNDEYLDLTFSEEGYIVKYRPTQYKKKIKVLFDPELISGHSPNNISKTIRLVEKFITKYFDSQYHLNDFILSGTYLSTDIHVGKKYVADYMKVIKRIGKVKGFSPSDYEFFDKDSVLYLKGNSNATEFMIYDLDAVNQKQSSRTHREKLFQETNGVLRAEVHLTKSKAIRAYTDEVCPAEQIKLLYEKREPVFMDVFARVIPFGDFYKKGDASELIREAVSDQRMRRRMLHLLALVPEKKSLYLAQKAMNCRYVEEVMISYAKINLSPITISKRHDVKHLKNLYEYL